MKKMLFISVLAATAVSISPAVTLEAGKISTITLKIKDQDISFSHSITDWVDGNNGSGNAPMQTATSRSHGSNQTIEKIAEADICFRYFFSYICYKPTVKRYEPQIS